MERLDDHVFSGDDALDYYSFLVSTGLSKRVDSACGRAIERAKLFPTKKYIIVLDGENLSHRQP